MQRLVLYDSSGRQVGNEEETDDRIEAFAAAGVSLAVDVESMPELVCVFSACEHELDEPERFYARYRCGTRADLFAHFFFDLEHELTQHGLDLASDTDALCRVLGTIEARKPGEDLSHRLLEQLLGDKQVFVRLSDRHAAHAFGEWYLDEGRIESYVVTEDASAGALSDYDLSIEPGSTAGIRPLEETRRDFKRLYNTAGPERRQQLEQQFPTLQSVDSTSSTSDLDQYVDEAELNYIAGADSDESRLLGTTARTAVAGCGLLLGGLLTAGIATPADSYSWLIDSIATGDWWLGLAAAREWAVQRLGIVAPYVQSLSPQVLGLLTAGVSATLAGTVLGSRIVQSVKTRWQQRSRERRQRQRQTAQEAIEQAADRIRAVGLPDGTAVAELDRANEALAAEAYDTARDRARQAETVAEREQDHLQQAAAAETLLEEEIEGSKPDEARDALDTAHEQLKRGAFEQAGEAIERAKRLAKPAVGYLLSNAREHTEAATQARENGNYADALAAWDDAREEYERALDRARALGNECAAGDIEDNIAQIEENRRATETERHHARMTEQASEADEYVTKGNTHFDNGAYKRAAEAYEAARGIYTSVIETAHEHGFEEAETFEDTRNGIERSIVDCRLSYLATRLTPIEQQIEAGEYEAAGAACEKLLTRVEKLEAACSKNNSLLRRRAQQGHVRAKLEQAKAQIEDARTVFEDEQYHEARETFEETAAFLEEVLVLADRYGLDEQKTELDQLIDVCTTNASEARRALFDVTDVEPELTTIDSPAVARAGFSEQEQLAMGDGSDPVSELAVDNQEIRQNQSMPELEQLEVLGKGGNATVWKVVLTQTDEIAALKVPQWDGTLAGKNIERFLSEAETWSKLDDHRHVVTVHDWGFDTYPWLLMEYIERGELKTHVGSLSVDRSLEILTSVADALAHARGIDHLDVKPANILLDEHWNPKLADWGLAKVAFHHDQTDTRLGLSPPYAAPEQVDRTRGQRDNLTDIYQLGVTGYEVLTGELPYDPDAPTSLEQRILQNTPQPPSELDSEIPAALDDVLLKAMATDRGERYETVVQFRNALSEIEQLAL